MDRRLFLSGMLGLSVTALAACATAPSESGAAKVTAPTIGPLELPETVVPPPFSVPRHPLPGGPIFGLPGEGNLLAWTVDDGASRQAIEAYARFCAETGTRLTFFVTAQYPSWREAAPLLQPMVESGQIQIANHTMRHPSLTSLSDAQIQDELLQTDQFIREVFGVEARPFYRRTYGHRDARTDAAAAAIGYTAPTMWYGTLGDAAPKSAAEIVGLGNQWFLPQHIVIGHANFPEAITEALPQLHQIVQSRGLTTVTLNDVFEV